MTTRTLLLAAAALAIPCSAAHAIDFPVSTSAELTTALSTAQSNGTADRLLLAPGAYSGAFSYSSSEDLDVIGSGQNATEILGSGASNALDLFSSAATFHVADLTVAMATNTPHGIWITGHGTIERTTVTMAAGATGTAMYVDAAGATVQHVEVDGGGTSSRGIQFEHAGAGTITDSTIYSTGYGVLADANGGSVTAARLNITGPTFEAVAAQFGASIAISDSLIDLRNFDGTAFDVGDSNNPTNFTSSIDARRLTIVGDGTHNQFGARTGPNGVGDNFSIALRDSVIVNVKQPLVCSQSAAGTGAITADYSSISASGNSSNCSPGITQTHSVTNANLGFADAANHDYRLLHSSPLVDAGDPSALAATTDLGGLPRPVDGNGDGTAVRDVGAYEYQPPPPAPANVSDTPLEVVPGPVVDGPAPGAAPGGSSDTTPPLLAHARLRRGVASFTLSEIARLTVTIDRRVDRHWRRIKGSFKLSGSAGANAVRVRAKLFRGLRPGRYRLTIVARDAAGNRSKATHVVVAVLRRR